jgi:hypothetical protein
MLESLLHAAPSHLKSASGLRLAINKFSPFIEHAILAWIGRWPIRPGARSGSSTDRAGWAESTAGQPVLFVPLSPAPALKPREPRSEARPRFKVFRRKAPTICSSGFADARRRDRNVASSISCPLRGCPRRRSGTDVMSVCHEGGLKRVKSAPPLQPYPRLRLRPIFSFKKFKKRYRLPLFLWKKAENSGRAEWVGWARFSTIRQ